jgi:hypothetical protein
MDDDEVIPSQEPIEKGYYLEALDYEHEVE